jgi:hypothetical protein
MKKKLLKGIKEKSHKNDIKLIFMAFNYNYFFIFKSVYSIEQDFEQPSQPFDEQQLSLL